MDQNPAGLDSDNPSQDLSVDYLPMASKILQVPSNLLTLCHRISEGTWPCIRPSPGNKTNPQLSSMGRSRARSGAAKGHPIQKALLNQEYMNKILSFLFWMYFIFHVELLYQRRNDYTMGEWFGKGTGLDLYLTRMSSLR